MDINLVDNIARFDNQVITIATSRSIPISSLILGVIGRGREPRTHKSSRHTIQKYILTIEDRSKHRLNSGFIYLFNKRRLMILEYAE